MDEGSAVEEGSAADEGSAVDDGSADEEGSAVEEGSVAEEGSAVEEDGAATDVVGTSEVVSAVEEGWAELGVTEVGADVGSTDAEDDATWLDCVLLVVGDGEVLERVVVVELDGTVVVVVGSALLVVVVLDGSAVDVVELASVVEVVEVVEGVGCVEAVEVVEVVEGVEVVKAVDVVDAVTDVDSDAVSLADEDEGFEADVQSARETTRRLTRTLRGLDGPLSRAPRRGEWPSSPAGGTNGTNSASAWGSASGAAARMGRRAMSGRSIDVLGYWPASVGRRLRRVLPERGLAARAVLMLPEREEEKDSSTREERDSVSLSPCGVAACRWGREMAYRGQSLRGHSPPVVAGVRVVLREMLRSHTKQVSASQCLQVQPSAPP